MCAAQPPLWQALRPGQLVEVLDAERVPAGVSRCQLGQLLRLDLDEERGRVLLIDTCEVVSLELELIRSPTLEPKPHFDVLWGPASSGAVVGAEVARGLASSGFSVVQLLDRSLTPGAVGRCLGNLHAELPGEALLGRLPREVEESYLGRDGRAAVAWVDPSEPIWRREGGEVVLQADAGLTALAELLQTYASDAVHAPITDRSAALLCVSMTDAEEARFEHPPLADKVLKDFYGTWSRSVVRLIHFVGPGGGAVHLRRRGANEAFDMDWDVDIQVPAMANTILVFREACFEYSYEEPDSAAFGETFWLQCNLLQPSAQWSVGELTGDLEMLDAAAGRDGPPPPSEAAQNLVAVVGMSIQAAGKMSDHLKEWAAYVSGTDGQLEMPFARFDYKPYYSDDLEHADGSYTYVKHFSVQDGIEMFDNKTFEISNLEAAAMDPICRQVLEVGYLSIFQLGITKRYCNTNPMHASVSVGNDKQEWNNMPGIPRSVSTNNQLAVMANRFSYVFNLKGGSFVTDTACSSSLVGAHLGKANLLERRWDPLEWHLGLGAGLTLTVWCMFGNCAAHMLSPAGRCLTFNATANGYNRGDGTSAMVIKAGAQPDLRIAFFRGSQIGQDGRSASMAAPNGPAQEKCIWGAIREAQMSPPEATAWECHGTGTALGDPIEVGAVRKVQIKMKRSEPLMVATSKSNLGHLEGSAAQLAMNKCIMQVIRTMCAPTQHLKTLNPHLDHSAFDAIFVSEHCPYKYKQGHAQVSSFGVGGTNGHAIFWGEREQPAVAVDRRALLLQKLQRAPPLILVDGADPGEWEFRGVPYLPPAAGGRYEVSLSRDPATREETITYEKIVGLPLKIVDYYAISGSHNSWSVEPMSFGEVPHLFYQDVELPDTGTCEFRLLEDGDAGRAIGPKSSTTRRSTPIVGPAADLQTAWQINGAPGSIVTIELFAPSEPGQEGLRTITWYARPDG